MGAGREGPGLWSALHSCLSRPKALCRACQVKEKGQGPCRLLAPVASWCTPVTGMQGSASSGTNAVKTKMCL
jgi:hypothetical protein